VLTSVLALGLSAVVVSSPEAVAAGQTAKFFMLPQLAQPGSSVAGAGQARSAMWAKFRPARPGRKVILQRKSGVRWVDVAAQKESRRGVVQFTAPYKVNHDIARYRVSAVRYKGLRKINSASEATDTWGSPAFDEQFSGAWRPEWSNRLQGYTYQRHCARTDALASAVTATTAALSVLVDPNPPTTPCSVNSSYAYRLNGMIGTQRTQDTPGFAFRYGFAAARIKFQPGAGQHAGFWLQTDPRLVDATAQRYEIDAIEWYGNHRNADRDMSSQVHVCTDPSNCQGSMVPYPALGHAYLSDPGRFGSDWSSKYHVFSVQWTRGGYVFRIDGKPFRSITEGVSQEYEYLVLSLLSSDWELHHNPDASPRQTMNVDWVRVWSSDHT
jgi:hypothetical protein